MKHVYLHRALGLRLRRLKEKACCRNPLLPFPHWQRSDPPFHSLFPQPNILQLAPFWRFIVPLSLCDLSRHASNAKLAASVSHKKAVSRRLLLRA